MSGVVMISGEGIKYTEGSIWPDALYIRGWKVRYPHNYHTLAIL